MKTELLTDNMDSLNKDSVKYLLIQSNYRVRSGLLKEEAKKLKGNLDNVFKGDVGSALLVDNKGVFGPFSESSGGSTVGLAAHSERESLLAAIKAAINQKWGPFANVSLSSPLSTAQLGENPAVLEALKQLEKIHVFSERAPCNFSKQPVNGDKGCEFYLDQLDQKLGGKIRSYSYLPKYTNKDDAPNLLKKKFNELAKYFGSLVTTSQNQQAQAQSVSASSPSSHIISSQSQHSIEEEWGDDIWDEDAIAAVERVEEEQKQEYEKRDQQTDPTHEKKEEDDIWNEDAIAAVKQVEEEQEYKKQGQQAAPAQQLALNQQSQLQQTPPWPNSSSSKKQEIDAPSSPENELQNQGGPQPPLLHSQLEEEEQNKKLAQQSTSLQSEALIQHAPSSKSNLSKQADLEEPSNLVDIEQLMQRSKEFTPGREAFKLKRSLSTSSSTSQNSSNNSSAPKKPK